MLEFDPVAAPTEVTIVRYFEKDLKPSIKAEIDQEHSQLINYEELIAKAVRAKARADLRPSSYVRETDLSCLQGNRPAYTTAHKIQTQGAVNCGDGSKTSKSPASTPASASTQDPELADKTRKDKKKNCNGTKGIPGNPETPRPPKLTWLRSETRKEEIKKKTQRRLHVISATNWGTT